MRWQPQRVVVGCAITLLHRGMKTQVKPAALWLKARR